MVKFRVVYIDRKHQDVEAEDYSFFDGFVSFMSKEHKVLSIAAALVESIALADVPEAR